MEENTSSNPPEKKGLNYSMYVIVVIIILVVVVGGMYLYKKNSQQTMMQNKIQPTEAMMEKETTTPAQATTSSEAMQDETQKITVTASNFTFDPKTITVKKGQPVELTFKNSEGMHDFVIDEFNVKTKVISAGQSEAVTFTPDKAGTFNYYCSVGNHRAMGMQGTITVE